MTDKIVENELGPLEMAAPTFLMRNEVDDLWSLQTIDSKSGL
jgi:hypothetical protein